VLVTPWNETRGIVDVSLARLKKKRIVAVKTASVLVAPYFVQHSPYFLASPHHYIQEIKDRLGLVVNEMPIPVPSYQVALYWHKTRTSSKKTQWFIDQLRHCFPGGRVNIKPANL
jgi:DNA-binding transcriptional LysR family regulator